MTYFVWYESKVNIFIHNILGTLLFISIELRCHILVYTFFRCLFISNSSHFIELFDNNPLCVDTVLHYGLKLKTNKLYHISSLLPFSCIRYNSIWYHSMQIWNLRMCNEIKIAGKTNISSGFGMPLYKFFNALINVFFYQHFNIKSILH